MNLRPWLFIFIALLAPLSNDAGAGVVRGTVFMVAHPVVTAQGVANAVAHPINTGSAIASGIQNDWNSGAEGQGRVVGGILLTVAMAGAPAAEAGNLAKAGEVAGAGEKVEQVSAAAQKSVRINSVIQSDNSVYYSIQTSQGAVTVTAEVVKNGSQVQLKDIGIFSEMGPQLSLGSTEVMQIRSLLVDQARSQGFKELRITGQRMSGANPGKSVDITIDLTNDPK